MSDLGTKACLGVLLLALAAPAEAGPTRHHDAHVHGRGELNLVLEGDQLVANLEVPGADLVGFEHAPQNDAQVKAVESAVTNLGDAARILGLPDAAQCRQDSVDVDSSMLAAEHDHDHDHGKSGDHAEDEHAEFKITYKLTCAAAKKLDHIAVGYFAAFQGAQELVVQAVGPWGQTSKTLTRAAPRLTF